jgi:hypothetical protein
VMPAEVATLDPAGSNPVDTVQMEQEDLLGRS